LHNVNNAGEIEQWEQLNYWEMYLEGFLFPEKQKISKVFEYFPLYGKVNCGDVYPEWFGAYGGDKNYDDFYAMKYALAFAANHAESKTLSLAGKTYHVCGTINYDETESSIMPLDIPLSIDISQHLQSFENPSIKLASPVNCRYRLGLNDDFKQTKHLTGLRIIGEPGATLKSTSFTYSYEPNNTSPGSSKHKRREDFGKHLYFELANVALVKSINFIDVGLVLRNQEIDDDGSTPLNPPQLKVEDCKFEITQDWESIDKYNTDANFPPSSDEDENFLNSLHRDNSQSIVNNWPNRCIQLMSNADTTAEGHEDYELYFGDSLIFKYQPAHQRPIFRNNIFLQTNGYQATNGSNDDLLFYGQHSKKGYGIVANLLDEALVEHNLFEGLNNGMFINGSQRSIIQNNTLRSLRGGIIFLINKHYGRSSVLYNKILNNYIEDVFEESISFDSGGGGVFSHKYKPEVGEEFDLLQRSGTMILQAKVVKVESLGNGDNIDSPLRLYFQLIDGWQFLSKGYNSGGSDEHKRGMVAYYNFIFDAYLNSGQVYCTILEGGQTVFTHQPEPVGNSFKIISGKRTVVDLEYHIDGFPKLINDDDYQHGYIDIEYFPERISNIIDPNHPGHLPSRYKRNNSDPDGKLIPILPSQLRIGTDALTGCSIAIQYIFGFNVIQGNQIYFNEARTAKFQHVASIRNGFDDINIPQPPEPDLVVKDLNANRRRWKFYHDFGQDANGILLYGSCHYNVVANNITHGARIGIMGVGGDDLGKEASADGPYYMPANIVYAPCNFNLLSNNVVVKANIYCLNLLGVGFYPYPNVYEENPILNLTFPIDPLIYDGSPNRNYRPDVSDRYFFNFGNQLQQNVVTFGEYRLSWQKLFKVDSGSLFDVNTAKQPLFRETMLTFWRPFINSSPILGFEGQLSPDPRHYLWVDNLATLVSTPTSNAPQALQDIETTINP